MKLIAFVTFYLVLIAGCNDASQPQEIAVEKAPTEQTGENTYLMYCAQCHGASGDGMGLLKLDRPARSFIDSGFSFGNTVHAISKTTSSGIPGTPMPPFSDVLTKKQIEDVATYVRSFAKTLKEVSASETEMIVEERPLVARGMIPPINDACALHPRGLIIGNPDGFSYEYRVDDVRLLAIRQGRFIERADWGARGGSPLTILGKISVLVEKGNPNSMFTTQDGIPLRAQLTSTNTLNDHGVIRYDLFDKDNNRVASVEEFCKPTTGARALIEQIIVLNVSTPIKMNTLQGTVLEGETNIPVGTSTRNIFHATKGIQ